MRREATEIIKRVLVDFYEKRDVSGLEESFCDNIVFYGSFSENSCDGKQEVIDELHREIQLFPVAYTVRDIQMKIIDIKEDTVSIYASYEVIGSIDKKGIAYHLSSVCILEDNKWKLRLFHNSFTDSNQKELMSRMEKTVSRYHQAIADTDLSIWYYDVKKKCIMQDGNSYNIHGFGHVIENVPESLIECGYVHPDDAESFRQMYQKIFDGEPKVNGDFWVHQTEKNAYWCERIAYKVVFNDDGEPVMALGSSRDVSLEKENERRYKEELSYKTALQDDGLGSYILNLKRNEIISSNEREDVFHLINDSQNVDEFFDNCLEVNSVIVGDADVQQIFNRNALLEGFRDGDKTIQFESEYCDDKRQTKWLQWTIRILKNPQNEELTAFLYIEDVTEPRILQEIMRTIINQNYDYIEVVDIDTKEAFRYEDSHMIHSQYDKLHNDVFVENDISKQNLELDYVVEQLAKNESYEYSCSCLDNNGEQCYKQWRFWYMSEERRKVIFVRSDITELIKDHNRQKMLLEDALHKEEIASNAKGSFLSKMSHEIRTPLNAIIGYLAIANDSDCSPAKKDYCIENCESASKHLLQIINDILDMSSIESGKLKISSAEFDLTKEITSITSIFFQNANAKNIHFETHVQNITEEIVVGDQLRLKQVLMNLLSNAVKFTPEDGRIQLKVEQLRKDSKKVYMKFTVKDTGIGMSQTYMSRIFQPFEQENANTAQKYGGSGLGLSITNNLVSMMGGKIDVQSKQGEGTTFEVTMFFGISAKNGTRKGQVDYSNVRVLVVDDKKDEGSYIQMMLKRCGAKADTVTSGATALRRIRSRKGGDYEYDLCIIDWNMPEMDGCEATHKIRSEFGEEMPIIIATAYNIGEFETEAMEAGANRIIAKPLFQSTLFDILVSSFGNYEPDVPKMDRPQIDLTGIRVLLAEDNPMNMDIAVTILEKSGIQVDQASNGQEAVDRFLASDAGTYNLILMDVQMPVMDGYEATDQIRKSDHPEAVTIPIVAMTANAFAEDVAQALSKGMNAHIAKPINYDKLFDILHSFKFD